MMKSTICSDDIQLAGNRFYLQRIFNTLLIIITITFLGTTGARACGPYIDNISSPVYFTSLHRDNSVADDNRAENVALWQKLTSPAIPAADIEQAVYIDEYPRRLYGSETSNNRFYTWLSNTDDDEAYQFLYVAKRVEHIRDSLASPWYYPSDRDDDASDSNIEATLRECLEYDGTRFRDRYALQAIRLLFTLRRYAECADCFERAFMDFDDSNLFKRMARRYAAGSWQRMGEVARANEYFAKSGDLMSLKTPDRVAYMALRNPDCPQLMDYLQRCASSLYVDTTEMLKAGAAAREVLSRTNVRFRGDWEFLLSYTDCVFRNDTLSARRHISRALSQEFSTSDLRDHARAFRIMLDAAKGLSPRIEDLRWLESKTSPLLPDARHWRAIISNIICGHWVRALWGRKDYATAILLAGFAEYHTRMNYLVESYYRNPCKGKCVRLSDITQSEFSRNRYDYGSLPFQLMESLSSRRLTAVTAQMKSPGRLYTYLRGYARLDSDYVNELAGTLALREQDYQRAFRYLSKVSHGYQKLLNVYRDGYLAYDPFINYDNRHHCDTLRDEEGGEYVINFEIATGYRRARMMTSDNAKLNFARQMLLLQKEMKSGKTADARGLARLRYAIGLRNSFEQCWALTQYSRGLVSTEFHSYIAVGNYRLEDRIPFLYSYTEKDAEAVEKRLESEITASKAMLTGSDAKAKAELMLGNIKTVVKCYAQTPTARYVKSSCDRWRDWL